MADSICQTIGKNIRERRKAEDLTLEDLADLLGVSYQQVQKYEKGRSKISGDKLVLLAHIFQCSIDDLCGVAQPSLSGSEKALASQLARISNKELRQGIVAFLSLVANSSLDVA